jgi:hypothetical protein
MLARLDKHSVSLNTSPMGVTPDAILRLLDELELNRKSRRSAWATLQRLRKFLEADGTRIATPGDRNFESEGEAIESGLRRTVEGRDTVMRSLVRAVYRFRDATLVAEKKDDFGNALQNLYRELERAENLGLGDAANKVRGIRATTNQYLTWATGSLEKRMDQDNTPLIL